MTITPPEQLTSLNQWVNWRYEKGDRKVPYIPGTQTRASSTDRTQWRSYEAAVADRLHSGIGFVFSDDDPFVGVDLDDCLTADGEIKEWAAQILAMLPATYTEVSPSGNGLKLFYSGEIPARGRNRREIGDGQIEIYARGRYFTVTGDVWRDSPVSVSPADFRPLYDTLFPATPEPAVSGPQLGGGFGGDNESMIEAIRRSKQGEQFSQLYDHGCGDGNHSEADQSLCNIIAFWAGPNPKRIDRVFRQSALMRDKWDSSRGDTTYGGITIQSAIAIQTAFYQPPDSVYINEDSDAMQRAKRGKPFPMTDVGNAERLAANFKGRIRYAETGGGWYVYDGKRWERDEVGKVGYFAIRTVRQIYDEARLLDDTPQVDDNGRKRDSPAAVLAKHAARSEAQARIAAMVKLCATMPGVAVSSSVFDRDPWLFNCSNGTIDLRTGLLREHRPDDNITKLSPASYHPSAKAEKWGKFLDRIFHGNEEMIQYVQQILGMSLSGDISEQIMPIFFGGGSNGKSTLLDTVVKVMGSYAGPAAPDLLTMRQNETHPTEIADLWGMRLVIASETDENKKLRNAKIKEMTGDEQLKARYMRGDYFTFNRTHKMVLMTNHKPVVREDSTGMWRRIKLVPFTAQIKDEERDRDLGRKLFGEFAGILAWLVRGCQAWLNKGGLDDPAEVRAATDEYRSDENPLGEFVSSCIVRCEDGVASYRDVRAAYLRWCESEGVARPLGERTLNSRVAEVEGVGKGRSRVDGKQVRIFSGITIDPMWASR